MAVLLAALIVFALSASPVAVAQALCFEGDQKNGQLEFAGAVEGSGFTGRFEAFSVTYCLNDGNPAASEIRVTVELSSADTNNRERDQTLKGEEFFAVEDNPRATWTSDTIARDGNAYVADGELALKGIRAAQKIRFTLEPDGQSLVARGEFVMLGGAEVDRQRFDIGTGEFADPDFVRNRVDVSFEVSLEESR